MKRWRGNPDAYEAASVDPKPVGKRVAPAHRCPRTQCPPEAERGGGDGKIAGDGSPFIFSKVAGGGSPFVFSEVGDDELLVCEKLRSPRPGFAALDLMIE
ncbi:hypothetical protein TIFTF001_021106 [Ficus carica]|uniref:Uncharacterized protein n=1 Tax=Ficus carica TaxID=3494 RepID=A0AA88AS85_FICCA|nr:hypothetical protein TIFTF001_021106 [Ficus carica]